MALAAKSSPFRAGERRPLVGQFVPRQEDKADLRINRFPNCCPRATGGVSNRHAGGVLHRRSQLRGWDQNVVKKIIRYANGEKEFADFADTFFINNNWASAAFVNSLSQEQRQKAVLPFNSDERLHCSNYFALNPIFSRIASGRFFNR